MALRNYQALRQYQIHSVRPTGKILGNGAYGEVLEAKIPGAVCAVKRMHAIFEREVQGWVDQEMVDENRRKFVNECELMSRLRHPHIVQFLGVCEFPGSDTPALVTELLDTDLHSLLLPPGRASSKPYIPRDFKFSILRDVARGLLFLHSQLPPIIHRDLTATNVLLNSAMVAKIADLGVARLIPEAAVPKLTKGPGNAAYMPPEAEGERYNEALDIFSLGVLSLFTLTQTFPDPLPVKYKENGKFLSRTEAQRRSAFIEQSREEVKEQGWLVDTIQQCLHDDPDKRPTAEGMLSLLESTRTGRSEDHVEKSKLELVQIVERGREEGKSVVETKVAKDSRAVMVVGSILPPPSSAVPQTPTDLSDDDRLVLSELDLPQDKWNNLDALLAIYNKTENYDVYSVNISKPGMELSRSYILEHIEFLLKNSTNKTGGAVVHYYGTGKRNTGDWCFKDGFITFSDIASLYMEHSRGRLLAVVPDCHSSGKWVSECAKFLDERGVKPPCGHSAKEKGILLKVYASCRTGQDSAELYYTTRAMELKEDGYVYHYNSKELSPQQNTFGVNFTRVRCKKGEEEECTIAADATWSTAGEVIDHRKFTVRGTDRGRSAWHFVVVDDDTEKTKDFIDKTQGQNAWKMTMNLSDYGKVVKSGWGKDPSPEDKDWFANKYGYP